MADSLEVILFVQDAERAYSCQIKENGGPAENVETDTTRRHLVSGPLDMNSIDRYWAYLLRVAADTTYYGGRFRGPVLDQGSFEYVPIPEYKADKRYRNTVYGQLTYGNSVDRYDEHTFAEYIQDKSVKKGLVGRHMHPDPDFANRTYGDVTKTEKEDGSLETVPKAATLRDLEKGNILVFCASLYPFGKTRSEKALYMIGYFEVERVYDFQKLEARDRWKVCKKLKKRNPHCAWARFDEMNEYYFEHFVLVEGNEGKSTLLDRAIQLTDQEYYVLPTWKKEFGLNSSYFPKGGRWLPQTHQNDLRKRREYISRLKAVLREHGVYTQNLRTV